METILVILLSSSVLVAIISATKDIYLWFKNRKANKEDKQEAEEKEAAEAELKLADLVELVNANFNNTNDKLTTMDGKLDAQGVAVQKSLGNTVAHLADKYIRRTYITLDELSTLDDMYEAYRGIHGNGTVSELVRRCHKLEMREAVAGERRQEARRESDIEKGQ